MGVRQWAYAGMHKMFAQRAFRQAASDRELLTQELRSAELYGSQQ